MIEFLILGQTDVPNFTNFDKGIVVGVLTFAASLFGLHWWFAVLPKSKAEAEGIKERNANEKLYQEQIIKQMELRGQRDQAQTEVLNKLADLGEATKDSNEMTHRKLDELLRAVGHKGGG